MPSTTRRDIASAYLASLTKITSWLVISALVYRRQGEISFAMLALVRSVIGFLNYASFGLAPAMIHLLATRKSAPPLHVQPITPEDAPSDGILSYMPPRLEKKRDRPIATPTQQLYLAGFLTSLLFAAAAAFLLVDFSNHATTFLHIAKGFRTYQVPNLLLSIGAGILIRLASDPSGAILQYHGRILLDNFLLAIADLGWIALSCLWISHEGTLDVVGIAYCHAAILLFLLRFIFAESKVPIFSVPIHISAQQLYSLLTFGLLVTLAQLADYLYAPTDFLLINHFLTYADLAAYAPCVQIDAALLLLVTALSTTLLPKAALAHARQDTQTLRKYYIHGTLLSTTLLLIASLATYLLAPTLLRLWLHDIPPGTLRILPLVLCHTVIGGSSAVGRSILLATGRVKPFTSSVLLAGLLNVSSSYLLVRYTHLGLTAIVLGTLLAVTLRCALFLPWYTLHTLSPSKLNLPLPLEC